MANSRTGDNRLDAAMLIAFSVFLLLGAFATSGLLRYALNYGNKVTATVDEVIVREDARGMKHNSKSDTYYIYVNYEYKGEKYTHILSPHNDRDTQVGDKLTLIVDPDDPIDLTDVENSVITTIVFLVSGIITGIIGILLWKGRI